MMTFLKLLGLIIVLNLVRYLLIGAVEFATIIPPLFDSMEASSSYFNNEFKPFDWVTSYLYNFLMWSIVVYVYHLLHPVLTGNHYVRNLKVFFIMWLFFAAVSAIYMNHYSHPKDFYLWNIADGFLVYGLLALANGFLYPLFFKEKKS